MSYLFYLTFIYLIFITIYYFFYNFNINHDNLFVIIINFIFLIVLPLYYLYFIDNIYSLVISILLFISAIWYNLKIKEIYHQNKILPIIYFLITSYIVGFMIGLYL